MTQTDSLGISVYRSLRRTMTSDLLRVFVYGSLRMGGDNHRASILRTGSGGRDQRFSCGWYPEAETDDPWRREDQCNRRHSTQPRSLNPARRRGRRDSGFATVQRTSGEDYGAAGHGHCSLVD